MLGLSCGMVPGSILQSKCDVPYRRYNVPVTGSPICNDSPTSRSAAAEQYINDTSNSPHITHVNHAQTVLGAAALQQVEHFASSLWLVENPPSERNGNASHNRPRRLAEYFAHNRPALANPIGPFGKDSTTNKGRSGHGRQLTIHHHLRHSVGTEMSRDFAKLAAKDGLFRRLAKCHDSGMGFLMYVFIFGIIGMIVGYIVIVSMKLRSFGIGNFNGIGDARQHTRRSNASF